MDQEEAPIGMGGCSHGTTLYDHAASTAGHVLRWKVVRDKSDSSRRVGQDGAMPLDDDTDDPTKAPIFKIVAWIVLVLVVISLILTVVLS